MHVKKRGNGSGPFIYYKRFMFQSYGPTSAGFAIRKVRCGVVPGAGASFEWIFDICMENWHGLTSKLDVFFKDKNTSIEIHVRTWVLKNHGEVKIWRKFNSTSTNNKLAESVFLRNPILFLQWRLCL